MANKVTTTINVVLYSDGASTTFSFDLLKDTYMVNSGDGSNGSGRQVNWFSQDPKSSIPTGVQSLTQSIGGITYTASLSGTVVTVTLSAALAAGGWGIAVYPTF
jgi:hypothetical protein